MLPRTCCTIVLGAADIGALDTPVDAILLTSATPDVAASGVADVLTGKTSTVGGTETVTSGAVGGGAVFVVDTVDVDGVLVTVGVGRGVETIATPEPAPGLITAT
jgi:hypothetical protein